MADLLGPAAILLVAFVVLGVTGFGSALIAVPLLSWFWPLPEVVALMVSLDLVASIVHGGLNLAAVQWRAIAKLVPGSLLGVALALVFLQKLPPQWPLVALGLYVTWVGWRALRPARQNSPSRTPGPVYTAAIGTVVGIIELLFGTSGPPIVAWMSLQLHDVRQVRASTPVALVFVSLIALAGMATDGRLSTALHWQRFGLLLPVALVGVTVGHKFAGKLPDQRLRKIVCGLLVVSGLALIVRALLA